MSKICGIDGGLSGGIVLLDNGKITCKLVMPTLKLQNGKRTYDTVEIMNFFHMYEPHHVYLESAQSMPKQGLVSTFRIGYHYGLMIGIMEGLKIKYSIVNPRVWQKAIFGDMIKSDTKNMSFIKCKEFWPEESWLATSRCKKPSDGLTDAACIGIYGLNNLDKIRKLNEQA